MPPIAPRRGPRGLTDGLRHPRDRDVRRLDRGVSLALLAVGLLNLVLVLDTDLPQRARDLGTASGLVIHAGRVVTVGAAGLLVLLSRQLARGKRVAWRVAVGVTSVTLALQAVGSHLVPAALSLAALVVLLVLHDRFQARPDPVGRLRLARLPFVILVEVALGVLAAAVVGLRASGAVTPGRWLADAATGLVGLGDTGHRVLDDGLATIGAVTLGWLLFVLFRPARDRAPTTPEATLRQLVRTGTGTLDYFLLRDDKRHVVRDGAAIGYRYLSGVGLGSGDPVGPEGAAATVLSAFVARCDDHGWRPAVVGVHERFRPAWEAAGLQAIALGDEAVLDVSTVRLSGQDRKSLRQAVNRIARDHTFDLVAVSQLSPPERAELRHLSDTWRGGQPERGFAMALGRIADREDGDVRIARARDADGELAAFLQLVPCAGGASLDVMRRRRRSPNGLNDFLIVRTAQALAAGGEQRLSLNFAVMRALLAADVPLRWWQRPLVPGLRLLSRWFQIESLYRFNDKFDPLWEPRVLLYRDPVDLPVVAIAALQAEAFLPRLSRDGRRD